MMEFRVPTDVPGYFSKMGDTCVILLIFNEGYSVMQLQCK